jgi:hypothetical protein
MDLGGWQSQVKLDCDRIAWSWQNGAKACDKENCPKEEMMVSKER